ncbi:hypothetical protein QJS10_CPA01g01638 [Acorus calamus]|uniref:Uncharacterized protein n=1 Tax=Acorus calamus TaxID=4465 RepID=A0AAV9FVM7_ACOCL|nr:hypothetical protein QJS10_CPA01g01638 [Acorus calamus]
MASSTSSPSKPLHLLWKTELETVSIWRRPRCIEAAEPTRHQRQPMEALLWGHGGGTQGAHGSLVKTHWSQVSTTK